MTSPQSELADFYPKDFYIDIIGKKFSWLGEVILPFIEEKRLIEAIKAREEGYSEEEKDRNTPGIIKVFT